MSVRCRLRLRSGELLSVTNEHDSGRVFGPIVVGQDAANGTRNRV